VFIQLQLMEYFQALATPDSGKVVQIVEDAGVERLVKQSELDGAVALKLDITADAPIIKMPKNSNSNE
jgi:vacuolar protein sorting-associated protein 13A/C